MGMTDVDDKIIKRAKENSQSPQQLSRIYENEFLGTILMREI